MNYINPTAVSADSMDIWTEALIIVVSGATGRVEVYDDSSAKLKSGSSAGDAYTFTMRTHSIYRTKDKAPSGA